VYRVKHVLWSQARAVKIFQDKEDDNWFHDLNSLTFLRDPNIVTMFYILYENSDRSQSRRPIGYIMELMAQSADDRFECSLKQLLNLFEQVASALACAHENGIIHFDVKPGNILFDETRTVAKLCDFGFAHKLKSLSMSATSSSGLSACQGGSLLFLAPEVFIDFMAPEVLSDKNFGSSPLLKLCDIFSFGKTMWKLLHQSRGMPFVLPLPFFADVHIPSDLKDLILQCTLVEPMNRPQSMSEVLVRLQRIRSLIETEP
jgi:serine/threonine protein kinase